MNNRTTKRALTRNKKWRKIDNTSIDRMTIEKTQEILEGDVTTKSDDQLFVIDKVDKKPSLAGKKEKWQNHQLSWEKRIQPNENTVAQKRATPPDLQRQKLHTLKQVKKKEVRKERMPPAPEKDVQYDINGNPLQIPTEQNGLFDIWNTADVRQVAIQNLKRKNPSVDTEWMGPLLPHPSKKRKFETPSKVPAVEPAHGGASYRPTYEDHQELLAEAVAEVIKQQEEEKRVNKMLRSDLWKQKSHTWIDGERDVEGEPEQEEPEENGDDIKEHVNLAHIDRKSRYERNKEMRKKEMKKIQIRKEALDAQRKEFEELPQILGEFEQQEEGRKERAKYKQRVKENADYKTKKLGSIPFVADPTAVMLTEELPSKLRQIKPKVDLLRDRYMSLQKRNIIEPRIKRFKTRHYPIKVVEKWSASK